MYAFSIAMQFAFATLLPVLTSVVLTKLAKRPWLANASYWQQQTLYGLIFGLIAIFGTEFGINTNDATMNVRDAAPLVAGLYFGSPAGIIAGLIGGIERWFSVLWGRGMFTRVACSVATIAVGFYGAFLNRYLFNERKPSWPLALAVGMVAEVLHLLLVFLTNLDDATRAFLVVQACSLPMISCNAISVALSGAAISLAHGQKLLQRNGQRDISQRIQVGMLGVVAVGFVATVGFTFVLQQSNVQSDATNTLGLAIADVVSDTRDISDDRILESALQAASAIPNIERSRKADLTKLADNLDVSEIHVVDKKGIIVSSNVPSLVGFDMASGKQSAAFLTLLPGGEATSLVQEYQPMTADSTQWRKYAGVGIADGFVQVGYDSSHFLTNIGAMVQSAVRNRHIGKDGFFVVLAQTDRIAGLRSDKSVSDINAKTLRQATDAHEPQTAFELDLHGETYYAMYDDVEGFRIIALLPFAEATQARDLAVLVTSFMEVLVFAALFAAIYLLIKNVVVRSIWQVNGTLDQITSGDLEAQVDVRDSTEFSSLSDDINRTVAALRQAIANERTRIERDLVTAKTIQESALPSAFPPFPEIDAFDIYASMNAAREVGGDFYDFFLIDDHTLGFLIADVSGKGIPASLFMMAAKSELSNYMKSGMDLAEAVRSANWDLNQGNEAGMFVTVWAATLDYHSGLLTYVNAGHNPPLLRHDGKWIWLSKKSGLFLGVFDMVKYRSDSIQLSVGDQIFLYTDGVNEAFNVDEEEFGNDRLEAFLSAHVNQHPHMLIDLLRSELRSWAYGAEQSDDITMLCLEYGVPPEVTGSITVLATNEGIDEIRLRMHYELSQLQCPEAVQSQIDLVVEELISNICKHGYKHTDEPGEVQVAYAYNANPSTIVISVTDWGVPFDPLGYQQPKNAAGINESGIGIRLVINNVDDISYVRDDDCNVIAFTKSW